MVMLFVPVSACGCNTDGTTKEICDEDTGECKCKPNFSGTKCDIMGKEYKETNESLYFLLISSSCLSDYNNINSDYNSNNHHYYYYNNNNHNNN